MLGTASVRLYLLGVSMGLVLYTVDSRFLPEMTFHHPPDTMDESLDAIREALSLDEILAPQATLGVFAAGALSYYTGRRSIDFLGKTDPHIARLPPDTSGKVHAWGMKGGPAHNKYDLNYSIRKLQPTYVEGFAWGNQNLFDWAPSAYVQVPYKGQTFWLLRDSPLVYWDKLGG